MNEHEKWLRDEATAIENSTGCTGHDAIKLRAAADHIKRLETTLLELKTEYESTEPDKYKWSLTRINYALRGLDD